MGDEEMVSRDVEYFNQSSQHDKKGFIKLAVGNSKHLINELKSQYPEVFEEIENINDR